jgi:hypothetical protein
MSQQQSFGVSSIPGAANIEFVLGNTGGNVPPNPATHVLNFTGDTTQGVHVNGTPGTFSEVITIDNATTLQKGVVLLASNAETIAGTDTTKATTPDDIKAKLGVQTLHGLAYGAGTAAALQWLGEAANGQIPIGQVGGIPVLANITSIDGTVKVTNGPGTIDLSVANEIQGTGQTIGAVTLNIISIPLGAVAGVFQFEARVKGFDPATPSGAGYNVYATLRTTGLAATLVGNQVIFNEDAVLNNADAYFIASGNNAVLQVLGVAGLTINWSAETEIT